MNIKLISLISLLLICASGNKVFAQDPNELILQMSQTYSGGTARMMGLGGGKVSLGADAGNIYLNPAGLGFYNRSEFVFSPQFDFSQTDTDFLNTRQKDYKLNFNIANLGLVFNRSEDISSDKKWRGGSFAFTLNRINDYHFNTMYFGDNANQDILTYAVNQDNFQGPTDFTDLFYNTFLTTDYFEIYQGQEEILINNNWYNIRDLYGDDLNQGDTLFFVDRFTFRDGDLAYPSEEFPTRQREEIRSRGAQYAASFSYGGNYNDRFYFGFGLNLMSINKEVDRIYSEEHVALDFMDLRLTDTYRLSGSGINASFGVIGRPLNNILIGLSYTTPTYYAMEESQEIELTANFTSGSDVDRIIVPSFFYDINMPSKIRGGITYFFGKNGFITADVETSNTQNAMLLNSGDFNFENNVNAITSTNFTNTVSAGVGGEYRMDMFRFRAGVNYISDPSNAQGVDYDRYLFSLGAGIRKKNFFFDAAYTLNKTTQTFSPYPSTDAVIAPTAASEVNNNYITTSIGFTF
ncbi:MAG: OmpP1/FadL family transporter [Candidatus Cyclobacteriaceae bacterium M2_1C_046]